MVCVVIALTYVRYKPGLLSRVRLRSLVLSPILFARMKYEQEHIAQEYRNFAENTDFLENVERQRDAGVDVMRRALTEPFDHADVCPLS